MCVNLKTSIIAYLIGTISSLLLIQNNNKEKKNIGYYILFFTCVQLFEALIYYNNKTIYSRLLLINLGFQGLVTTTNEGMKWVFFLDNNISSVIGFMYVLMFALTFHYNNQFNYINKFSILVFLTFIISYNIDKINPFICNINKASIWCLSSAIISPIILLL